MIPYNSNAKLFTAELSQTAFCGSSKYELPVCQDTDFLGRWVSPWGLNNERSLTPSSCEPLLSSIPENIMISY